MTVTQDRTATRQKNSGAVPEIRPLPIAKMLPSSDNRRRPITKASVESLARSMRSDGLIQPVVVRPHPSRKGFFEIRAGERRWHAAKAANLTHLPAIIRKLDDQSALSVTLAENIQRENFHPLEEAATIQLAFDRGYDVKAIAAHLGKPLSYIARRASLTRLTKAWKDEILRPESNASRLSAAHLELIARLPEETQRALAEHEFNVVFGRGFLTVAELRRVIDQGLHSLIAMPWSLDDETLDPKAGSCLTCTKRSGKQPLLFDDEEAPKNGKVSKTDRCLDPSCYDRKNAAYLGRCETTLRGKHPNLRLVQVTYPRMPPETHKAFADRVFRAYQPTFAKPNQANATPAMPIDGPKAGQLVYLTLGHTEPKKHGNGRAKGKSGKVVPQTMAERRAGLQRRRQAFVVKRVEGILKGLSDDDLGKIARRVESEERPKDQTPVDWLALLLAFGTSTREDRHSDTDAWPTYDRLRSRPATVRAIKALRELIPIWARRLSGTDGSIAASQAADGKRMCELLGIDIAAIEREAAVSIPEPKSWRNAR
jgi:ParB/RepB/Spo0J family partition protein